jgi:hypothetical protein
VEAIVRLCCNDYPRGEEVELSWTFLMLVEGSRVFREGVVSD